MIELGTVVVIGGGCYGSFYTRQLEAARDRGKVTYNQLLVVDRDPRCQVASFPAGPARTLVTEEWSSFLDSFFRTGAAGPGRHVIVPSPLMPHLMYQWLFNQARRRWPGRDIRSAAFASSPGTPYDATAPDHTRYVSHADWICPTHCTEPARCPVIRAPRTWEMGETVARWTEELNRQRPTRGPVLLECRHTVNGVGTFDARAVLDGLEVIVAAGESRDDVDVVVGTVSGCHGAVNLLRIGPAIG